MATGFGKNLGLGVVSDWIDPRRNALIGLGAGLAGGNDWGQGISQGFSQAQQGLVADNAYTATKKADAERADQLNQTVEFLRSKGREDLIPLVSAGQASMALTEAMTPAAGPDIIEVNGQLVNRSTGAVVGDYRTPNADAGEGYTLNPGDVRYGPDNKVVAEGPPKPVGNLSPTAQKELFEAEDAATAGQYVISALDEAMKLSPNAYEGPAADMRAGAMSVFGDKAAQDTQRLQNVTTELALTQLRTVFGASPTEGERQILLELQGSVNQPKSVREDIYKRAKVAADRRIKDNQRKAEALRSGQFFEEGYSGTPITPGGDPVSAADALLSSGKY